MALNYDDDIQKTIVATSRFLCLSRRECNRRCNSFICSQFYAK